jgi:hypothetical protein
LSCPPASYSFRALEAALPLELLPSFHRSFLGFCGIPAAGMPLRRVAQRVEAELKRLVAAGRLPAGDPGDACLSAQLASEWPDLPDFLAYLTSPP